MLVIISNMFVLICNRFHTTRANNGQITSFWRVPFLTPSFEGNPFAQEHKILSQETRILGAAHSKDFVILACTVLIQIQSVTDGQTGRQTEADTQAMAKTRDAFCCRAQKGLSKS